MQVLSLVPCTKVSILGTILLSQTQMFSQLCPIASQKARLLGMAPPSISKSAGQGRACVHLVPGAGIPAKGAAQGPGEGWGARAHSELRVAQADMQWRFRQPMIETPVLESLPYSGCFLSTCGIVIVDNGSLLCSKPPCHFVFTAPE